MAFADLRAAKRGDHLLIGFRDVKRVELVEKVTKFHAHTATGQKFRHDGRDVNGPAFGCEYAQLITPEQAEQFRLAPIRAKSRAARLDVLKSLLQDCDKRGIKDEQIEAAIAALSA